MAKIGWLSALVLALASAGPAAAAQVTLGGSFGDPGNGALVGSDLGPALFGDDGEIANNVALYVLSVPVGGTVTFDSDGFATGGAEPYFTIFQGAGGSATFLESNFFASDIDFFLSLPLAAGDYTLAIGAWQNMSFAENQGVGTLADGFIGLGVPDLLGSQAYQVVVDFPVPEPASAALVGFGVTGLALLQRRRRRPRDGAREVCSDGLSTRFSFVLKRRKVSCGDPSE